MRPRLEPPSGEEFVLRERSAFRRVASHFSDRLLVGLLSTCADVELNVLRESSSGTGSPVRRQSSRDRQHLGCRAMRHGRRTRIPMDACFTSRSRCASLYRLPRWSTNTTHALYPTEVPTGQEACPTRPPALLLVPIFDGYYRLSIGSGGGVLDLEHLAIERNLRLRGAHCLPLRLHDSG